MGVGESGPRDRAGGVGWGAEADGGRSEPKRGRGVSQGAWQSGAGVVAG